MSYNDITFRKENLDYYLRELAKEFRKLNGKVMTAEIILIGGASIVANYGFREMTYDMDAVVMASSAMNEAIHHVGDRFGLPNGWLNTDFMRTKSYSPKLIEHSDYYKTFSNIMTVRTIRGEYLIAMKLMSGRKYKNDLSDVVGILMWHEQNDSPITLNRIKQAVTDLYEDWGALPEDSTNFINKVFDQQNYREIYESISNAEGQNKNVLLEFNENYPGVTTEQNVNVILEAALKKMDEEKRVPTMGNH